MKNKRVFFLSHSTKDHELAGAIEKLLTTVLRKNNLSDKYEVFYSPKSLKESSCNWRNKIVDKMRNAECCIMLVTPNSLENKWVNFEIGLALALDIEVILIGKTNIDFTKLAISGNEVIELSNQQYIENILKQVFKGCIRPEDINESCNDSGNQTLINNIIKKFNQRDIYIVGSEPANDEHKWNEQDVELFVTQLSNALLRDKTVVLSSYPLVPHIGSVVKDCVIVNHRNDQDRYRISGLYDFDKAIEKEKEKTAITNDSLKYWEETLDGFRKVYLEEKDVIIIIGGGSSTKKEADTARHIPKLQILPIPCFGGYGEKLFVYLKTHKLLEGYDHPCNSCDQVRKEGCKHISDFVKRSKIQKDMFISEEWDEK